MSSNSFGVPSSSRAEPPAATAAEFVPRATAAEELVSRRPRLPPRDVGSSNSTFLNGGASWREDLSDGDVLGIDRFAMLVVLGPNCLGLDLQPPSLGERRPPAPSASSAARSPTASRRRSSGEEGVRSDLVRDPGLDRGIFRTRSALLAMLMGAPW